MKKFIFGVMALCLTSCGYFGGSTEVAPVDTLQTEVVDSVDSVNLVDSAEMESVDSLH